MSHVYCTQCGFQNPETANYCSRCGALLEKRESGGETTQTISADEVGELAGDGADELEGPALVVRSGGGRAGESFLLSRERTRIGRSPECEIFLDDVTVSRKHAVVVERDGVFSVDDQGSLNGTFVNRHRIDSAPARKRRRASNRQVPPHIPRQVSMTADTPKRERLIRIGEVVRRLSDEFSDISISKIRFLEDEGLLTPQRTRGGYRLFSEDDVERLTTILRLQRDEFLPLRVIREELDAAGAKERKRKRPTGVGERGETIDLEELCERSGITPAMAKELEEFGLLQPAGSGSAKRYPETDADIAGVCVQLSRYGAGPRHLRTFRTAIDRETALIGQLMAPALQARNAERRAAGLRDLQTLGELAEELSALLFWRDLRDVASR